MKQNFNMAKFFYSISSIEQFKSWSNKDLHKLVLEISTLSLTLPIYNPIQSYETKAIKNALNNFKSYNYHNLKELEYLTADNENNVYIKGFYDKKFTPLQLVSIFEYILIRLTGECNLDLPQFSALKCAVKINGGVLQNQRF